MQNQPLDSQKTESKLTRTGTFKGDWNETCQFCGEKQIAHRTTHEWIDGEILEHRKPCQPETDLITRDWRNRARAARLIVLVWWVIIPLMILLINEIEVVARIAFAIAIIKLIWEVVKIYGNPEKWFPAYGRSQEKKEREESRKRHYIWHCERNPEGFARLRDENFERGVGSSSKAFSEGNSDNSKTRRDNEAAP